MSPRIRNGIRFCLLGLYLFGQVHSSYAVVNGTSGQILDREISAAARTLSFGAGAMPSGLNFLSINPAQINWMPVFETQMNYDSGYFSQKNVSLVAGKYWGKFPLAATIVMQVPETLTEIDDEGTRLGGNTFWEGYAALTTGHQFTIFSRNIFMGYSGKIFNGYILGYSAVSVLGDIGLIFPFNWKQARYFSVANPENFHFGLSILNAGMPIKYIAEPVNPPTSIVFSLDHTLLNNHLHKADIVIGNKIYLFKDLYGEASVPSLATEYTFYRFFRLRSGVYYELNRFLVNFGGGIVYNYQGIYSLQADYNITPGGRFGDNQLISIKGMYAFQDLSEKFGRRDDAQNQLSRDINSEITELLSKSIVDYKLQNGSYPRELGDVLPVLDKKYGIKEIPRPSNGFYKYDNINGTLVIVQREKIIYKDVFVMKDGSRIICNIEKELPDRLLAAHEFGKTEILKSNIAYSYSDTLNSLDQAIIQSVQDYVNEYKKHNGMYPASLSVLLVFLKKYNVERLPELSYGKIIYDSGSGFVKAGKRYDEAASSVTDPSYIPPSANPAHISPANGKENKGNIDQNSINKPDIEPKENKRDVFKIE